MPNYNAKENSNNFGGKGPKIAGAEGGRKKGENSKKRREMLMKRQEMELNEDRRKTAVRRVK